jgi:hypothetical protein
MQNVINSIMQKRSFKIGNEMKVGYKFLCPTISKKGAWVSHRAEGNGSVHGKYAEVVMQDSHQQYEKEKKI